MRFNDHRLNQAISPGITTVSVSAVLLQKILPQSNSYPRKLYEAAPERTLQLLCEIVAEQVGKRNTVYALMLSVTLNGF